MTTPIDLLIGPDGDVALLCAFEPGLTDADAVALTEAGLLIRAGSPASVSVPLSALARKALEAAGSAILKDVGTDHVRELVIDGGAHGDAG